MTDKTKKTLSILLLIISILLLLVSLQVVIKDFSPQDQEASTIPKKTKKWNPGHYIQLGNTTSAGQINSVLSEPAASGIKGVRVSLYWEEIEPQQNVYSRAKIDEYLNALPPGKKIMLMMWERDYWGRTCSGTARLPKYIKNHPNNPALNFSGGCIAQTWKPDIQDRWVKALNKVAEYIDNDNRVEAIIFPESSFGIPEGYEGNVSKLRDEIESGLISIHTGIAPQYKKTHVFQNMNWIGGRTCVKLDNVAQTLRDLGHGISNPDSPPWRALPFGCTPESPYNYAGLKSSDGPVPIFTTYRRHRNTMPIMVGGDTSQFEDPENPRTFNNKKMNYTNLVEQLYFSAVTGYTYTPTTPDTQVGSLGANYMLWAHGYNSITAQRQYPDNPIKPAEYTSKYKSAYLTLARNPLRQTILSCPSNIYCAGVSSPKSTDLPKNTANPTQPINTPTPNQPTATTKPSNTPVPTQLKTTNPVNTVSVQGKCGKGDIDGNGNFGIADFAAFAIAYGNGRNLCGDTASDHNSYGSCGGKDVNRDGKLDIFDFGGPIIGFAQRYGPHKSCNLP